MIGSAKKGKGYDSDSFRGFNAAPWVFRDLMGSFNSLRRVESRCNEICIKVLEVVISVGADTGDRVPPMRVEGCVRVMEGRRPRRPRWAGVCFMRRTRGTVSLQ
jgi:hypothetical protein